MKHRKALAIIIAGLLFFLTALTFYLNRVIFPGMVKGIVVQRLEETLKRRVEIGSLHFNWVRGFIIDRIKIYEKTGDAVFAQADQVSFGVLFFPGFKHCRVTIPFVNVVSPAMHLIHSAPNSWNFSDMLPAAPKTPVAAAPAARKGYSVVIAWGGLTVKDGKLLLEDRLPSLPRQEYFENINLKLALSYKGISYDFTADIPAKNGLIGATVYYQPANQSTRAHIRLKNIDSASYLALFDIPGLHLNKGTLQDIDLDINYTQRKTTAQGNVTIKDLDIANADETFKGDINIRGLVAQYEDGYMKGRGDVSLSNMETTLPGLAAGGSIEAKMNDFELSKKGIALNGSLHGRNILVSLKDRRINVADVALDNIRVRQDKKEIQSVGSIVTQGLVLQWPSTSLQGDLALKNASLHMKNSNDVFIGGSLTADHFSMQSEGKKITAKHLELDDARLEVINQKDAAFDTKMSLEALTLRMGEKLFTAASLKTDRVVLKLNDGMLAASTTLNASNGRIVIEGNKTIEASPQMELNIKLPVDHPKDVLYKGSITLSGATLRGFAPFAVLDNVELDADFQNDKAAINMLSADILDTYVTINGTVKNFKDPYLDIVAEADELNLTKIQTLLPALTSQYGIELEGSSNVKMKFKGAVTHWADGDILAVASVKNASAISSKLHQRLKNITGIIEAAPDSLKWRDFTADYQGKKYSSAGRLENFKAPRITASLSGPGFELKTELAKHDDLITIKELSGKLMGASFDSRGTVRLTSAQPVFDIKGTTTFLVENLIKDLPAGEQKNLRTVHPTGLVSITAEAVGRGTDWKNYTLNAQLTSPLVTAMGYNLNDLKIEMTQDDGKIKNLSLDGKLYEGTVHAVGSADLKLKSMPFDLDLNINNTDLHALKLDSPLKMEEINGKLFLTAVSHGSLADIKNTLQATGSVSIKDGFLAEFNLFKGLLSVLNDALHLGQVMITDVDGNFTIKNQKINTDDLRLKGPTIVLLTKGWVNFDELCDLNVSIDLSSGIVPAIAHDVLQTVSVRIYDKLSNPKFKRRISMPQVINSLLKNLWQ